MNDQLDSERLVVITRADDGSTAYELHAPAGVCRFTVKRWVGHRWLWGCDGINWPIDAYEAEGCSFLRVGESSLVSLCHEAGWLTFGWRAHRRCLRKVLRAARARNRRRAQERQLETRGAPDYISRLEQELLDG